PDEDAVDRVFVERAFFEGRLERRNAEAAREARRLRADVDGGDPPSDLGRDLREPADVAADLDHARSGLQQSVELRLLPPERRDMRLMDRFERARVVHILAEAGLVAFADQRSAPRAANDRRGRAEGDVCDVPELRRRQVAIQALEKEPLARFELARDLGLGEKERKLLAAACRASRKAHDPAPRARTSIRPSRTRTSKSRSGKTAGPSSTRPSARQKREPCHGQRMSSPATLPTESEPPR